MPVSSAMTQVAFSITKAPASILPIASKRNRALRESEERLRLALEAGRMGSWDWNILTGEVKWSDNLEEIHGMAPGSFGGTFDEFLRIVHPQDRAEVTREIAHAIETGTDYDIEFRILWADGSVHWILGKGLTLRNSAGQAVRMIGLGMDVTDRKRAEEALRQAHQQLAFHIENSPLGVIEWDHELRISHWSHQAEHIFGWKAEELIGKVWSDWSFIYEADQAQVSEIATRLLNGQDQQNISYNRNYAKDGRVLDCEWYNSVLLDDAGKAISILSLIQDVSDRKRTEAALRESEAQYRDLVEAANCIIVRFDTRGIIRFINDYGQRFFGYEANELIGHNVMGTIVPEMESSGRDLNALVHDMRHHPERYALNENENLCKNGDRVWVVWSNKPILDEAGNVVEILSVGTNVTERKQAEEALRRSELKFRNIFNNSQVGIFRTRLEDGLILEANQKYVEFTGLCSPEDVIGKRRSTEFYVHPEDRDRMLEELLATGEVNNFEMQFRQQDGSIRWGMYSVRLNQEEYCLEGVITDITASKQAEEALRRNELKYRNIFENSQVGIGRTRLGDGMFLEVNQRYAEIMGFNTPADLVGRRFTEEFYANPADRDRILEEFDTYGEVRNFEEQLRRPDGSIAWGLLSLRVNPEEGCLDFVLTDISERKRLEEELRQSQQFLNSIIENIPLALFAKDIQNDFRYVLINNSSEKILGFSRTGAIGLTDYDLIPQEQADFFRAQDLQAVQQKTLLEVVEQPLPTTQETILARTLKLPLFDDQGNPTHLLCIAEDITDRKQREEALRLIVEGTASKTGDEFFRACVRYLARVLRVRYALVSEHGEDIGDSVHTLACWSGDGFAENFTYCLQNSPCEQVFQGRTCYYPADLQQLFPEDALLVDMKAESYLGVPLIDSSGEILGHMAVMDNQPMESDPGRELILKIFAARAGAELERKQAEDALARRAQIDSLLSSISRQFIDQDGTTALDFALEAIAQLIEAERASIFEYSPDQSRIHLIQAWHAPNIKPLPHYPNGASVAEFSYLHHQVSQGDVLQIAQISALPPNSAERNFFTSLSVQSAVVVPMIHSDRVVGFLGADVVHYSKTWSHAEINLLKLVGELIAIGRARHKAESALRIAKDAAEAANRAKSAFLANMSHELRTPLNAILGFSQLMERDIALTANQRNSLVTINRSGEHLLNLINDVLEMSKIEAGRVTANPVPFDLLLLLQTLREMFQIRAAAKHLSLQFELASDLPQYVFTDEGKLRQVLINLLGNAIKFTQRGGVVLRLRVEPGEEGSQEPGDAEIQRHRDVETPLPTPHTPHPTPHTPHPTPHTPHPTPHTPYSPPLTLFFEVEDTGCGIALEEMDRLFEPFVQTTVGTQTREGTGLGLAISRQFVQLMGGDIYFVSTVDVGSTFYFEIPVTLADPVEVVPPSTSRRVLRLAPDQPAYRILVVDDRPENRDLIAQLLSTIGFEVRTADNGQEAIAQWQTYHPHLIWMDMRMPVMNGYEATRQIRAKEARNQEPGDAETAQSPHPTPHTPHPTPHTPHPTKIIALTASAFEEQRSNILAAGCDDFVGKPFKEQEIFEKMAHHLGVKYIYEEPEDGDTNTDEHAISSPLPPPSSLQTMSPQWITQLHQAALRVDANQILKLIEQIPESDSALARSLKRLVNDYCFDEILELTQANLN
ncbi:PAS domain S-box protein [Kovacikia minuta CCNUW1]|uniref:PAS domain S-box protein n=1 Tax=Kovacikia minuta TaxID=2931930 RepID=UPI001CCCE93B|nr:PAS domain S-box protein [Kovacikia minuta]UBF29211.1 PAS domain S-box protein [Kovacikia minuta CCNUW1]